MNPFDKDEVIKVSEERLIHRVSLSRIMASLVGAFNLDYGLIYTLKRMFREPGNLTKDYLYLGRYHYTPPFRMLIVTTTLAVITVSYSRTGVNFFDSSGSISPEDSQMGKEFLMEYYNLFLWLYIPILALFSWLFNRRSHYNYAENLVYQTYLMIISIILYPIILLEYFIPSAYPMMFYFAVSILYSIIGYKQFFEKAWWRSSLEVLLIFVLGILVYGAISAFVIGILVGYNQAAS